MHYRLATLKGKWLLTVNDSPSNREIFKGSSIQPIARANGIEKRKHRVKNALYHELIIQP